MADAIVTLSNPTIESSQKVIRLYATVAVSASPATYAAGGLAVDLSGLGPYIEAPRLIHQNVASNEGSGYVYVYNPATGKLMILEGDGAGGPGVQIATAAVPAGVSGDTIQAVLTFSKALIPA